MNSTTNIEAATYPKFAEKIPLLTDTAGQYKLLFAQTTNDLDRILKLRFEVFNLELREGLDGSYRTCRDSDEFDEHCHHLMVVDTSSNEVIGTYRMQTREMALTGSGFYSAAEFDLAPLVDEFLPNAVELGRACVASAHRNSRVLYLLWRGLAAYMICNQKRFFFGCCSLTSQDPIEAKRVMDHLRDKDLLDPVWQVAAQPAYRCYDDDLSVPEGPKVKLPRLMRMYLDYGARIASEPAIDRQFKTIDYLAVFDMQAISPRVQRMFVD